MLTYYDRRLGRERIKRRYTWALWSFCIGLACGAILAYVM